MRMRGVTLIALPLAIAGVATGVWFEPTCTVQGWARGEQFFQGRPSRWWGKKLLSDEPADQAEYPKRLQEGGPASVAVLTELMRAPEAELRWQAAGILGKLGHDAKPAAPTLVSLLSDPDLHVRTVAAQSLGEIHPNDNAVIAGLVSRLGTDDRRLVIRPLSSFKGAAVAAVPGLIAILQNDSDATMRWEAARTLGKIGPGARDALPELMRATKDRDALVREHAAEAIGDIGPEAAEGVPALVVALGDSEAKVRRDAVRSLGQIGPAAKSALPQVEKLLNDPETIVRDAAKTAIRRIDPAKAK